MDGSLVDQSSAAANSQLLAYPTVVPNDMGGPDFSIAPVVQLQGGAEEVVEAHVTALINYLQDQEKDAKQGKVAWRAFQNGGRLEVLAKDVKEAVDSYCTKFKAKDCDQGFHEDWKMVARQADIVTNLAVLVIILEHYKFLCSRTSKSAKKGKAANAQLGRTKFASHYAKLQASFIDCVKQYKMKERNGLEPYYIPRIMAWLEERRIEWDNIYKRVEYDIHFKELVTTGQIESPYGSLTSEDAGTC